MLQLKNILVDLRILADSAREDSERRNYTTYPDHIDEFNRLLSAVERAGLETDLEPIRSVPSNQLAAFGSVGMGTNAEIAKLREIANKSSRLLARIVAYQEAPPTELGEPVSAMQRLLGPLKKPVAFMSYAHRDNKDGRLTNLRERLANEVSVRTGEDFEIFQDRQDILWGQNWKQRIEESLDEVTFLIAIVTPSFFTSQHCRDELQRFLDREKELGRNDLVLPIYYVDSPLMNDAARRKHDELTQALLAHQYADWRQLRGASYSSSKVRKTLERLATQVYEALERVQESQMVSQGGQMGEQPSNTVAPKTPLTHNNQFFSGEVFNDLAEAKRAAEEREVPMFIVIYDNKHFRKSKLEYSLGYFMEYPTTKKLVNENFVQVLLQSEREEASKLVPQDDPLENSLLVVLTPDGSILRQEGVYANPDEGLRRVREDIKKWEARKGNHSP